MKSSSHTKAHLNLFDFTMIVVSLVIGMGIFRTPVNVAKASPEPWIFFAAWFAGGLVALCGALTYAEIGSRLPVMGGYYRIFSYAYHPSLAFSINCIILISNAASGAAVALIGAEYLQKVIYPDAVDAQAFKVIIAITSILLFYGVNLLGLKMSARAQNVLTMIKIGLILLLILPIFFAPDANIAQAQQVTETATRSSLLDILKAFGVGLVAVSFTYGGYQQTINFGSEVKDPAKTMPRGIFLGIGIIIALYLTINFAYYRTIGFEQLKSSEGIAAIMATKMFGSAGGTVLSLLLFLSVLAYINVLLLSNPRVMYAMSEDGVLPKFFGRKLSNEVLFTSLSTFAAIAIAVVFYAKEFDEILSFTIFLDCIGMAFSAGSIFLLRKRHIRPAGVENIYTMKAYPLLPLIFIAAYVLVAASIIVNTPMTALTGVIVLSVFIGIYFLLRKSFPSQKG